MDKKKLAIYLQNGITNIKEDNKPMDEACWNYQHGLLLTGNEAKYVLTLIKKDIQNEQPK